MISTGSLRGGLAGAFSNGAMFALSRDPMEEAVTVDVAMSEPTGDKMGGAESTAVYGAAVKSAKTYSASCRASPATSGVKTTVTNALTVAVGNSTVKVEPMYSDDFEKIEYFQWRVRDRILALTSGSGFEYAASFSAKNIANQSSYKAQIQTSGSAVVSGIKFYFEGDGWLYDSTLDMHSHGTFIKGYKLNQLDVMYLSQKKPSLGAVVGGNGNDKWVDRYGFSDQDETRGDNWLVTPYGMRHGYTSEKCKWKTEQMQRPK